MLRIAVTLLLAAALVSVRSPGPHSAPMAPADTVQAGDPRLDPSRLSPFTIVRGMTLSRGDTVTPFGHQSEQLSNITLAGQTTWLDVQTFATPRATTVDSSWLSARTLQPLRMWSGNSFRTVELNFAGRTVRGRTVPANGAATTTEQELSVRPFEWNTFGLAISALPLEKGYRVMMPVYSDRFGAVSWYTVEVVGQTALTRASGFKAPMWEVVATSDSAGPAIRYWVSQRHRFVDRALLAEPGVTILYSRE